MVMLRNYYTQQELRMFLLVQLLRFWLKNNLMSPPSLTMMVNLLLRLLKLLHLPKQHQQKPLPPKLRPTIPTM